MSDSSLFTYVQASQFLGVRVGTLYSMVSRREIPHVRLGRRLVRFVPEELRVWVEARRVAELPSGARPRHMTPDFDL